MVYALSTFTASTQPPVQGGFFGPSQPCLLILFLLLQSDLLLTAQLLNLENILPSFEKIRGHSGQSLSALYRDISLISVCSFVVGFSKKFIPHVPLDGIWNHHPPRPRQAAVLLEVQTREFHQGEFHQGKETVVGLHADAECMTASLFLMPPKNYFANGMCPCMADSAVHKHTWFVTCVLIFNRLGALFRGTVCRNLISR